LKRLRFRAEVHGSNREEDKIILNTPFWIKSDWTFINGQEEGFSQRREKLIDYLILQN
jgi:hypothetical protein